MAEASTPPPPSVKILCEESEHLCECGEPATHTAYFTILKITPAELPLCRNCARMFCEDEGISGVFGLEETREMEAVA